MVYLEKVSEKTFGAVLQMKTAEEQRGFVASNVYSLAEAWLDYRAALPLAICSNGEAVGFMMLDCDKEERTVGIWRFMIASEHQRKGYGRKALEAVIAWARREGVYDMMHLDYVPGNTVAKKLYSSLGFRENGKVEDGEIIMTLPLTDSPKTGMLTADGDDAEELCGLLASGKRFPACAGGKTDGARLDPEMLRERINRGEVTRFTLMGESIGLAVSGILCIDEDNINRLDDIRAMYRNAGKPQNESREVFRIEG